MPKSARSSAQERFALMTLKQDRGAVERDAARQAIADKTARLRALRLAKEAAETSAGEASPAVRKPRTAR